MSELANDLAALRMEREPDRPRRRWVAWLIAAVAVGAAGAGGWRWVSRDRPVEVETATVSQRAAGTQAAVLNAAGYVTARRRATVSSKIYVILDTPKKATPDAAANVPMRGIEPAGLTARSEVSIVEGRMFQFGTTEVIVGRAASGQFVNMNVGDTIVSGQNRWQVVGLFEADGGIAETEVWTDGRTLQGAYRRGNTFQSVLVQLDSAASFDAFRDWLTSNPQVNVGIRRENEYYAAQSQAMTRLIRSIGFGIAGLMGVGAVFGAILTMYTAVATRAREIATLRALGFDTTAVLVSVLAESLALGAIGGVIGGAAAYLAFNGVQTSTMNFQTFSQVAFAFRVTPELLVMGLVYALAMGLVGGLLPAIRAARLPIPTALREL